MRRIVTWCAGGLLLACVAIFAGAHIEARQGLSRVTAHDLTGRSPTEVGQIAHDYVQTAGWVQSGDVQVRLARPITPAEMPNLGLGCPIVFGTIEEPPLMLVILQGDFTPHLLGSVLGPAPHVQFIAFVYDLWAGEPTLTLTSPDGGAFRAALQDPSLPTGKVETAACPTEPAYARTLHYGDTAPPASTATLPAPAGP